LVPIFSRLPDGNPVNKFPALQFPKQATDEGCSAIRAEVPVCDKCVELDRKIEHYRRLVAQLHDPVTTERLGNLIETMEALKVALHPEQQK
jgi:hypothetical protein